VNSLRRQGRRRGTHTRGGVSRRSGVAPGRRWTHATRPVCPLAVRQLQSRFSQKLHMFQPTGQQNSPCLRFRRSGAISRVVAVGFEPTEACTSHAFEVCDAVSQGMHTCAELRRS
jgi:hypothetical protein